MIWQDYDITYKSYDLNFAAMRESSNVIPTPISNALEIKLFSEGINQPVLLDTIDAVKLVFDGSLHPILSTIVDIVGELNSSDTSNPSLQQQINISLIAEKLANVEVTSSRNIETDVILSNSVNCSLSTNNESISLQSSDSSEISLSNIADILNEIISTKILQADITSTNSTQLYGNKIIAPNLYELPYLETSIDVLGELTPAISTDNKKISIDSADSALPDIVITVLETELYGDVSLQLSLINVLELALSSDVTTTPNINQPSNINLYIDSDDSASISMVMDDVTVNNVLSGTLSINAQYSTEIGLFKEVIEYPAILGSINSVTLGSSAEISPSFLGFTDFINEIVTAGVLYPSLQEQITTEISIDLQIAPIFYESSFVDAEVESAKIIYPAAEGQKTLSIDSEDTAEITFTASKEITLYSNVIEQLFITDSLNTIQLTSEKLLSTSINDFIEIINQIPAYGVIYPAITNELSMRLDSEDTALPIINEVSYTAYEATTAGILQPIIGISERYIESIVEKTVSPIISDIEKEIKNTENYGTVQPVVAHDPFEISLDSEKDLNVSVAKMSYIEYATAAIALLQPAITKDVSLTGNIFVSGYLFPNISDSAIIEVPLSSGGVLYVTFLNYTTVTSVDPTENIYINYLTSSGWEQAVIKIKNPDGTWTSKSLLIKQNDGSWI